MCGLVVASEMPTVVGGPPPVLPGGDSGALETGIASGLTAAAPDTSTVGVTGGGAATVGVTGGLEAMTATAGAGARTSSTPLTVGTDFGSRYHIIKLLGVGGMGAVYQAWDKTLEVAVAVKVIRPLASMNPEEAQAVEKRFKRELLLARSVTHQNVVRIHDLGEIDGITYITMPYVQGSDLSSILKRDGRIPVDRTLSIMKQVGAGLAAAHKAGVVHRDLKPANIMVDADGEALIMDFGIARSTESGATMTVGGAVVGTIEYMAPEQARGETVDARADIYAFGLIMNDLLLGRRQGGTNTAMASLMARMQAAPPPIRSVDPALPEAVDAIVTRCVQPDPAARYPQMADLLADLDRLDENGHPRLGTTVTAAIPASAAPAARRMGTRTLAIAAGLVIALGAAGWYWRDAIFPSAPTAPTGPPVSLAILPFRNASGDPTLDSLGANLSQELTAELGQSARVRTVSQDRVSQVLKDLQFAPGGVLQAADLSSIADFTNARRVLSGDITKLGDSIRINATLQNLDNGQPKGLTAVAANPAALMTAVGDLAGGVRDALGQESRALARDLKSSAVAPPTTSFDALKLYNEGVQLARQGKDQEAQTRFQAATDKDGSFALAFAGLAGAYQRLGYENEAAAADKTAMNLADARPPAEKYAIQANHFTIVNDTKDALAAYESLAKASPNDAALQYKLGDSYERSNQLDQARAHFARVAELDPKDVTGLTALGRVEIKQGNPQQALAPLSSALNIATQFKNDAARADILQAIGVAYKRLNRPDEALKNYNESLDIKTRLGNKAKMAGSLTEIAQVQGKIGKAQEAEQTYQRAMALQREIGDSAGLSATLVNLAALLNENLGRPDDAVPYLREALQIRRTGKTANPAAEAAVLNSLGVVYLAKGNYDEAQTNFERALEIREKNPVPGELADTLHNLGETLSKSGRYDEALGKYERSLQYRRDSGDKRGIAIESYSMGTIFDDLDRYGAAVKAKDEALQTYRDLKLRDMWLGEILSGRGNSLALSGRMDDAAKSLDEAMTVARELKNPILIAQTARFQADRLYYMGDAKGAVAQAKVAEDLAAQSADRSLVLLARATAALADQATAPTPALAARFAALANEAETLGLKALSVECLVHDAETLLATNDRSGARAQADKAIARAETGGFRLLLARARYVKATVLRQSKDPAATAEFASALNLLNDLKAEDGNANVVSRADVNAIYKACETGAKGA